MTDWPHVPLADVAIILMGQSPPGSTYNRDGRGLPFLQGSAEFGEHFPNPEKWCSAPAKIAEPGDLMVSVRAPVGDTNLANQRIAVGRGLAVVRGKKGALTGYLRLVMQDCTSELLGLSGSGMFSSITASNLRAVEVPIPSEPEQRRIVDLVGTIDTQIESLRVERDAVQLVWAALVHDLDRHAVRVRLGDLLLRIDAGKSPSGEERQPGPGEKAVLRVNAIEQGHFNPLAVKTVSGSVDLPERIAVRQGDVLMVRANGVLSRVGQVCQVRVDPQRLYLCDKTLRLVPKPEMLLNSYLRHALSSRGSRAQIEALTAGSHMRNLSQQAIRQVEIPLPGLQEQRSLAAALDAALGHVELIAAELESLRDLRSRLISALLTREVEIPDSYDALRVETL